MSAIGLISTQPCSGSLGSSRCEQSSGAALRSKPAQVSMPVLSRSLLVHLCPQEQKLTIQHLQPHTAQPSASAPTSSRRTPPLRLNLPTQTTRPPTRHPPKQCETVSDFDAPNHARDPAEFQKLDEFLRGAYPLVFERLKVEKVGRRAVARTAVGSSRVSCRGAR
jgi:hypothetical protein